MIVGKIRFYFQAILFYTPHLLFKNWEGGKVKNIIAGLNRLILDKKERAGKEKMLADYVVESKNTHNYWAMKMLIVDFLNLINVVGQVCSLAQTLKKNCSSTYMHGNIPDYNPSVNVAPSSEHALDRSTLSTRSLEESSPPTE